MFIYYYTTTRKEIPHALYFCVVLCTALHHFWKSEGVLSVCEAGLHHLLNNPHQHTRGKKCQEPAQFNDDGNSQVLSRREAASQLR